MKWICLWSFGKSLDLAAYLGRAISGMKKMSLERIDAMKKRYLWALLVAVGLQSLLVVSFLFQKVQLCKRFPEVVLNEDQLYLDDDSNLAGCFRNGNVVTSLTGDPNVYFHLDQPVDMFSVTIDSALVDSTSEYAQVFFITEAGVWSEVSFVLNNAIEYIESKDNSKMDTVRLDFSDRPDCKVHLNRIIINDHARMISSLANKYIHIGLVAVLLVLFMVLCQYVFSLQTRQLAWLRLKLLQIVRFIFFAFSLLILLIILFSNSDYYVRRQFLISNIWMLSLAVFVLCICFRQKYIANTHYYYKKTPRNEWAHSIVVLGTAFLFLMQILVAHNAYFESGWDAGTVTQIAKSVAANTDIPGELVGYLSRCPNNSLITMLYALLIRINILWYLFEEAYCLYCLIIPGIVISCITCYLVYRTACFFASEKFSLCAWGLSVVLIGGSPWYMVPYSDSWGLAIPILSIYLYVRGKRIENGWSMIYRFLAMTLSLVGYSLKPQCAITLLALLIYEMLECLKTKSFRYFKQIAAMITVSVIVFISVNALVQLELTKHGVGTKEDISLGLSHYLMMGMNTNTGGSFSQDDYEFSMRIASSKERSAVNIQQTIARIQEAGVDGMCDHFTQKILNTYNDGGFGWGFEGGFYERVSELPNQTIAPFLREVLFSTGRYYIYYVTIQQFIWLLTMAAAAAAALKTREDNENSQISVIFITILGIFFWILLFECRARYLFIFVPLFCVLAGAGLENLEGIFSSSLLRRPANRICKG